jgi:ABC-type antimicrobial peptide transport system permease subunit
MNLASINYLAEKLGVSPEELHKTLLQKAYVDGIHSIISAIIGFILIIVAAILFYKLVKRWYKPLHENEMASLVVAPAVIISIVGISMLIGCTTAAIARLVSPEYYVLQLVSQYIKQFTDFIL